MIISFFFYFIKIRENKENILAKRIFFLSGNTLKLSLWIKEQLKKLYALKLLWKLIIHHLLIII